MMGSSASSDSRQQQSLERKYALSWECGVLDPAQLILACCCLLVLKA
jgi:hypothetical protein